MKSKRVVETPGNIQRRIITMTHEVITNEAINPQLYIYLSDPAYTAFVSKPLIQASFNILLAIEALVDAKKRLSEVSAKFDQVCKDAGK